MKRTTALMVAIGLCLAMPAYLLAQSKVPADPELARLMREAQAGKASAQYALGCKYQDGRELTIDPKKALYWFTKAASQGNDQAQMAVGGMYFRGIETGPDYVKARAWFLKQAARGNAEAAYNLGYMSRMGLGTKQDLIAAYRWYAKSAKSGYKDAADQCVNLTMDMTQDQMATLGLVARKKPASSRKNP